MLMIRYEFTLYYYYFKFYLFVKFNFWTDIRGLNRPVNIMVHENNQLELENIFHKMDIDFRVVIENVASRIKQQHDFEAPKQNIEKLDDFDYGKYHQLDEINAWIDALAQQYPTYISIFNVTRSFEGKPLRAFKISIPSSNQKKAMWFDGGIHA